MSEQGDQWHKEIDIVINNMKTKITEIKVKHREILQAHLKETKQRQSLIEETLLDLIELEKSKEVSPIIEYSSKIGEFGKFPPMVEVTLPKFISKPIDHEKLYSLFGQITSFSVSLLNQLKPSVTELLDKPECLAIIKTRHARLRKV